MHHLFRKQRWIMILMVFFMGWGGILLAYAKPMHAMMSYAYNESHFLQSKENVLNAQKLNLNEASFHDIQLDSGSDCHQKLQQSDYLKHQNHAQYSQQHELESHQLNSTCADIEQSKKQVKCSDCALLSCQPLTALFNFETIRWFHSQPQKELETQHFLYTAQHLTGYWQEILRPPKA